MKKSKADCVEIVQSTLLHVMNLKNFKPPSDVLLMYCACIYLAISPISGHLEVLFVLSKLKKSFHQLNFIYTQGQVQVELCSEANDQPDEEVMELLRRSENVVAVESPAYFRAYQPVLEALKTIDVSKIHFM